MKYNTIEKTTAALLGESVSKAMSYAEYRDLVARLAQEGKSTGLEQTEALTTYTQLNNKRMKRWDKTLKFSEAAVGAIRRIDQKITWLVLTESWCGDASPALPVMHKMAELNPNISLKIVLRDEHLQLMDRFLTNGNRSIPKLIAVDDRSGNVLNTWGPRSEAATRLVEDQKRNHGELSAEFKESLQVWYNKDKGQNILKDLLAGLLLE